MEKSTGGNLAIDRINDSRAFRDFLDARLEDGDATLPLDEALFEWEMEEEKRDRNKEGQKKRGTRRKEVHSAL